MIMKAQEQTFYKLQLTSPYLTAAIDEKSLQQERRQKEKTHFQTL